MSALSSPPRSENPGCVYEPIGCETQLTAQLYMYKHLHGEAPSTKRTYKPSKLGQTDLIFVL